MNRYELVKDAAQAMGYNGNYVCVWDVNNRTYLIWTVEVWKSVQMEMNQQ